MEFIDHQATQLAKTEFNFLNLRLIVATLFNAIDTNSFEVESIKLKAMILNIKPGNLLDEDEFNEFKNMISSRVEKGVDFKVDMGETIGMNLSKFNTLVKLYVSLRRAGKNLEYSNLQEVVLRYVEKTNFDHVFTR